MAGVVLERYIKANTHLKIAQEQIQIAKKIVGDTTLDRKIKKQSGVVLAAILELRFLMDHRMKNIRREFHDAMDDFDIDPKSF